MEKERKEKKYSKFQWFFYVILIPLLFAIILSLIILTFSGVNVFKESQKYSGQIPVISKMKSQTATGQTDNKTKVYELEAKVKDQKQSIDTYNADLTKKDQEIAALKAKITKLENQLQTIKSKKESVTSKLQGIATMYEGMSAKDAAAILAKLADQDVINIMRQMKTDSRGSILAKMAPDQAARITKALLGP